MIGIAGLSLHAVSLIATIDENGNGLSDVWEQRFNASELQHDADDDSDGFTNLEECVAGTDPLDSGDRPSLDPLVFDDGSGELQVSFSTLLGKRYFLSASNDLLNFELLEPNGWAGDGFARELSIRKTSASETLSSVRADFWANVGMDSIDDLTALATFPDSPDGYTYLAKPESPSFLPTGYGARIVSRITAPESGSFTFFVSANGPAELHFKTVDAAEAVKIAEILPAQTELEEEEWELYETQRANAINLSAGENYDLELRYIGKTPLQHVQVGWSGPGLNGIEKVDRGDLSKVLFASDFVAGIDLFTYDYDSSGQTAKLWPDTSLESGIPGMSGQAERVLADPSSVNSLERFNLTEASTDHFYGTWLFNMGSGHDDISVIIFNDFDFSQESMRVQMEELSSGTLATVRAGGSGGNEATIEVAFDETFRVEVVSSIADGGFEYYTPYALKTVAKETFDIYVSDMDGNLLGSATGLSFRDGTPGAVEGFSSINLALASGANIAFDDWEFTSGQIAGNGYLVSNQIQLNVDSNFFRLTIEEQDQDGDGLGDWEELALAAYYNILFFDSETTDGIPDPDALQSFFALSQGKPDVMLFGTDAAAFESNYPNITEDNGEIKLTREGSLEPLDVQLCFPELDKSEVETMTTVCDGTCCMLIGSAGDETAEPEDFILTDEDGNIVTDVVHFEFGETEKILTLTAVKDSVNEYPETVNIAIKVPEDNSYDISTLLNGASIQIFDLPESPDNLTLFTGVYSQDGAATTATTATGSITATLNGPRTEIKLWNTFSGLTSNQTTSHVHKAKQSGGAFTPGNIIFGINQEGTTDPLLGHLEGHVWNLLESSGATSSNTDGGAVETSKQIIIDSLFGQNGETPLYLNVHSDLNPAGEIWAFFGLSEGSIDEPDAPDPVAEPGSVGFAQLSGVLLEVEVRRFLNQSTFGATEEMVEAMLSQIESARVSDPDYHRYDTFEGWLDFQMDATQTTQTYLLDYLMATHFQLFWLAGVFDPARNPTDGTTTTPSAPIEWPYIDRSNEDPAYWYLNQVYPATFNQMQLASSNGLGIDRRFTRLPHFSMTHWHTMLNAGDQLRQKMGFALQQIVVTSNEESQIFNNRYGMVNYQDLLNRYAFDHYRDVLGFVNWSPIMGIWLSSMYNQKAIDFDGDGLFDSYPDENLARENMQLFSIGLFDVWNDGTLKLTPEGLPRQTYTNEDIKEFAKILTGQSISYQGPTGGNAPGSTAFLANENTNFNRGLTAGQTSSHTFYPMKMFEAYHSLGTKTFAGITIDNTHIADLEEQARADVEDAIDWLAGKPGDGLPDFDMINSHVSTPAFISLRLIQRFTTSNPSKEYLHRVATVFKDSEGHLGQTLKAILLDPEARNVDVNDPVFGMKKSPLEGYLQMLRALEAHSYVPLVEPTAGEVFDVAPGSFSNPDLYLENFGYPIAQINAHENNMRFFLDSAYTTTGSAGLQMNPFNQETVFNFYMPKYVPGGVIGAAELFSPEMQLVNEADVIRNINFFQDIITDGTGHFGDELGNSVANQVTAFGGDSDASNNDHLRIDLQALADDLYPVAEPIPGSTAITRGSAATEAPHWVRLRREGNVFTSSESSDGITWKVLESWTVPMANQVYIGLALTSHLDGTLTTGVFDDISLTGATNGSWSNQDIGSVSAAGSVTNNGDGSYSIQASGEDIWSTDDELHFMYQTLTGDGEIIAQVKSLVVTHAWLKGGVMIREKLSSDSKNVMTLISGERGVASQSRSTLNSRSAESIADEALVDELDDRLTNGLFKLRFPYNPDDDGVDDVNKNPREWIIDTITESYDDPYDGSGDSGDRYEKLSDALYLLTVSPEFQVRK